jgi:hypothetical protein
VLRFGKMKGFWPFNAVWRLEEISLLTSESMSNFHTRLVLVYSTHPNAERCPGFGFNSHPAFEFVRVSNGGNKPRPFYSYKKYFINAKTV